MKSILNNKVSLLLLLSLYFFLSLSIFYIWQSEHSHPPSGDEPDYLTITQGIAKYHTFEQTKTYQEEFATKQFLPISTLPADARPSPYNSATVAGPHGLFNVHNIGLPLLLSVPFLIAGTTGAKIAMIFFNSFIIVMAWCVTGLFTQKRLVRFFSTLAVTLALPFLSAANQIYPDLLAGLIALTALYWLLTLQQKRSLTLEIGYALMIAYLPWLQIKFSATAAVLVLALCIQNFYHGYDRRKIFILLSSFLFSLFLLGSYHLYAFDNLSGPYHAGALEVSRSAFMVFSGLFLDQNQGFLFQNPALWIGLFSLGLLFRHHFYFFIIWSLVFFSFLLPNSMHPCWYGCWSFSGRFGWAATVVFLIPTLLGLTTLGTKHLRLLITVTLANFCLQLYFFYFYTIGNINIYNRAPETWLDIYSQYYTPWQQWLPAFYNVDWAFVYGPNVGWWLILVSIVLLGGLYAYYPAFFSVRKNMLLAFMGATILVLSRYLGHHNEDITIFLGKDLSGKVGQPFQTQRVVKKGEASPGYLTQATYFTLLQGTYQLIFGYRSNAPLSENIASWQIFNASLIKSLNSGFLTGTQGQRAEITALFTVTHNKPYFYEFTTFWLGTASLQLEEVRLVRIHPYPKQTEAQK